MKSNIRQLRSSLPSHNKEITSTATDTTHLSSFASTVRTEIYPRAQNENERMNEKSAMRMVNTPLGLCSSSGDSISCDHIQVQDNDNNDNNKTSTKDEMITHSCLPLNLSGTLAMHTVDDSSVNDESVIQLPSAVSALRSQRSSKVKIEHSLEESTNSASHQRNKSNTISGGGHLHNSSLSRRRRASSTMTRSSSNRQGGFSITADSSQNRGRSSGVLSESSSVISWLFAEDDTNELFDVSSLYQLSGDRTREQFYDTLKIKYETLHAIVMKDTQSSFDLSSLKHSSSSSESGLPDENVQLPCIRIEDSHLPEIKSTFEIVKNDSCEVGNNSTINHQRNADRVHSSKSRRNKALYKSKHELYLEIHGLVHHIFMSTQSYSKRDIATSNTALLQNSTSALTGFRRGSISIFHSLINQPFIKLVPSVSEDTLFDSVSSLPSRQVSQQHESVAIHSHSPMCSFSFPDKDICLDTKLSNLSDITNISEKEVKVPQGDKRDSTSGHIISSRGITTARNGESILVKKGDSRHLEVPGCSPSLLPRFIPYRESNEYHNNDDNCSMQMRGDNSCNWSTYTQRGITKRTPLQTTSKSKHEPHRYTWKQPFPIVVHLINQLKIEATSIAISFLEPDDHKGDGNISKATPVCCLFKDGSVSFAQVERILTQRLDDEINRHMSVAPQFDALISDGLDIAIDNVLERYPSSGRANGLPQLGSSKSGSGNTVQSLANYNDRESTAIQEGHTIDGDALETVVASNDVVDNINNNNKSENRSRSLFQAITPILYLPISLPSGHSKQTHCAIQTAGVLISLLSAVIRSCTNVSGITSPTKVSTLPTDLSQYLTTIVSSCTLIAVMETVHNLPSSLQIMQTIDNRYFSEHLPIFTPQGRRWSAISDRDQHHRNRSGKYFHEEAKPLSMESMSLTKENIPSDFFPIKHVTSDPTFQDSTLSKERKCASAPAAAVTTERRHTTHTLTEEELTALENNKLIPICDGCQYPYQYSMDGLLPLLHTSIPNDHKNKTIDDEERKRVYKSVSEKITKLKKKHCWPVVLSVRDDQNEKESRAKMVYNPNIRSDIYNMVLALGICDYEGVLLTMNRLKLLELLKGSSSAIRRCVKMIEKALLEMQDVVDSSAEKTKNLNSVSPLNHEHQTDSTNIGLFTGENTVAGNDYCGDGVSNSMDVKPNDNDDSHKNIIKHSTNKSTCPTSPLDMIQIRTQSNNKNKDNNNNNENSSRLFETLDSVDFMTDCESIIFESNEITSSNDACRDVLSDSEKKFIKIDPQQSGTSDVLLTSQLTVPPMQPPMDASEGHVIVPHRSDSGVDIFDNIKPLSLDDELYEAYEALDRCIRRSASVGNIDDDFILPIGARVRLNSSVAHRIENQMKLTLDKKKENDKRQKCSIDSATNQDLIANNNWMHYSSEGSSCTNSSAYMLCSESEKFNNKISPDSIRRNSKKNESSNQEANNGNVLVDMDSAREIVYSDSFRPTTQSSSRSDTTTEELCKKLQPSTMIWDASSLFEKREKEETLRSSYHTGNATKVTSHKSPSSEKLKSMGGREVVDEKSPRLTTKPYQRFTEGPGKNKLPTVVWDTSSFLEAMDRKDSARLKKYMMKCGENEGEKSINQCSKIRSMGRESTLDMLGASDDLQKNNMSRDKRKRTITWSQSDLVIDGIDDVDSFETTEDGSPAVNDLIMPAHDDTITTERGRSSSSDSQVQSNKSPYFTPESRSPAASRNYISDYSFTMTTSSTISDTGKVITNDDACEISDKPRNGSLTSSFSSPTKTSSILAQSACLNYYRDDDMLSTFSVSTNLKLHTKHTDQLFKQEEDDEGYLMINDYVLLTKIGQGQYGQVWIAADNSEEALREPEGRNVMKAIKIIPKTKLRKKWQTKNNDGIHDPGTDSQSHSALDVEIAVMKQLHHRNIVPLEEVIDDPNENYMYLIMPYIDKGPVININPGTGCYGPPYLSISTIKKYMREISAALVYLHRHGVCHMDLKPDNMLLGSVIETDYSVGPASEKETEPLDQNNSVVYLSDFGVSEIFAADEEAANNDNGEITSGAGPRNTTLMATNGTPAYVAPEALTGEPFSAPPIDVWALGVSLYVMLYGTHPFTGNSVRELFDKIRTNEVSYPKVILEYREDYETDLKDPSRYARDEQNAEACIELIKAMLTSDPKKRPTAAQIRHHRFISKTLRSQYTINKVEKKVRSSAITMDEKSLQDEGATPFNALKNSKEQISEEEKGTHAVRTKTPSVTIIDTSNVQPSRGSPSPHLSVRSNDSVEEKRKNVQISHKSINEILSSISNETALPTSQHDTISTVSQVSSAQSASVVRIAKTTTGESFKDRLNMFDTSVNNRMPTNAMNMSFGLYGGNSVVMNDIEEIRKLGSLNSLRMSLAHVPKPAGSAYSASRARRMGRREMGNVKVIKKISMPLVNGLSNDNEMGKSTSPQSPCKAGSPGIAFRRKSFSS